MSFSVSSDRDLRVADVGAIFDRSSCCPPLALGLTGAAALLMLAFLVVGRPFALTAERVRGTGVRCPGHW